MNRPKSEFYFLLALLFGIFAVTFFIFKPFVYALILAVVFATVFRPVHKKILVMTGGKGALSSFLTTLCVLVVIIVPFSFLAVQIFQEATSLYSSLVVDGEASVFSQSISATIQGLIDTSRMPIEFSTDINEHLKQGLSWLLNHFGPLFANVAKMAIGTFVFLAALYYLFKDGHILKNSLVALSPLQDVHDETIFSKLILAINSVVKGSLAVAIIQGILTSIGFSIFGVPHAVLWGSIAAITALIPGVGTALVILPAILYLFFTGEVFLALGLFLWGMIAVGLVDNFLGPKLVERGVRLHPFLILLSILGGISFFGPLGFLLGPLVLSLLFALLEIYSVTYSKQ